MVLATTHLEAHEKMLHPEKKSAERAKGTETHEIGKKLLKGQKVTKEKLHFPDILSFLFN